jgi:hypothetical protein
MRIESNGCRPICILEAAGDAQGGGGGLRRPPFAERRHMLEVCEDSSLRLFFDPVGDLDFRTSQWENTFTFGDVIIRT